MDVFPEEETCTRLKSALDISELRDPQGKGVEFEVDEDSLNRDGEEPETDFRYFDKNKVAANICLMSDEEDNDEENTDADCEYFTEMERLRKNLLKLKDSDITPDKDGGVLKQLKIPGIGGVVPENALVTVHYNAYTDVGQPPYDSSRLRGQVHKMRLGKGESISGLELAVLSMKKGETSRFLIHHDYAYGKMGCPPRIPKEASLIFDVEVLHFVEQEGVDDYYSMTPEERRSRMKYTDIEKVVKAENAEAKEYFENRNYHKAFGKYKRAANILENYHLKSDQEENQWKKQLVKVYINSAICCHHLKHFGRTISYCNMALGNDKNNIKAHYFKGKALHGLGSFEDAKDSLLRARNLDPSNTMVSKALQNLVKSMKEHELFEKNMYKRMFSKPSAPDSQAKTETPKPNEEEEDSSDHGACSENFKALIKEQFEKFQKDSSMTELPFPKIQMNPAEINFILETAIEMGMDIKQRGTGNSLRYEVYKKTMKPD